MPNARDESVLVFPATLSAELSDCPSDSYLTIKWAAVDPGTGRRLKPVSRRLAWSRAMADAPEMVLLGLAATAKWNGWGSLSVERRQLGTHDYQESTTWFLCFPELTDQETGEVINAAPQGDDESWKPSQVMDTVGQARHFLKELAPVLKDLKPLLEVLMGEDPKSK